MDRDALERMACPLWRTLMTGLSLRAFGAAETGGDLPGYKHVYVYDPFGNRLEFMEPLG